MLEDLNMEKKPSNRSQGTAKPATSESKKNSDVQNPKQFPRSNRKREPANGLPAKTEPRKPAPQKGKVFDKRPRPRGYYYGNKKEGPQMNDEEFHAEFGSLFNYGSKKQSLNHLLNFHYEPRGATVGAPRQAAPAPHNISTKSLMSTHAHKYNKEQFLQANCQFIVRFDGDYGCYMGDPDLLVDWNLVELIRVETNEEVNCPICLYPPVAGKITRCGHVYCWTCILHYLALSDKTWRKCPICYEAIHRQDLKSVEAVDKTIFNIGQEITLQLMKREKGTFVAAPVHQHVARQSKNILDYGENEITTVYSKLLLAQKKDIEDIIQREHELLLGQADEYKGSPELCFVEEAMQCLALRKSELETGAPPIASTNAAQNTGTEAISDDMDSTLNESSDKQADKSEIVDIEPENTIQVEDLDIEHLTVSTPSKNFYFYQSIDGQHIYLHSINAKMLEMTYGSLENCPPTIRGKIVEKEPGSMTGELRKRLKYLQHVPITCQFEVVELELAPPLVSSDAVATFHDQIELRKKRRYKLARAEKRREKKIEEHERRQFGRGPAPNLRIESHFDFPECGELFEHTRPPGPSSELDKASEGSSRPHSPVNSFESYDQFDISQAAASFDTPPDDNGMSFAQMLRDGKTIRADSTSWPTVGQTGQSWAVGAAASGSCWSQPRRQRQASVSASVESDSENYALSPPARSSFNIAEALEAAARLEKDKELPTGGRKKKKKQQKVLFATGMQCPGN
ncbi:RING finger protein [Nesidiocoris tenuis]|uniref:E3 ubiquitin-protein ligase RNF10 n=1 Tax=Nesidiocoris tenuis TaxID=355587 RepID=A0ABN7AZH5_9HEMI|nr:RING finger protein [Nesidiocoris tenuis]